MQSAIAFLLASYIRLVYLTCRKARHVHPDAMPYLRGEQNAIFAFWHGRMMLLPPFCPPRRQMHVLISLHRDGLLISKAIGHFGQQTVGGSSSRGGREAVARALRLLEHGDNLSVTPDGPRGPHQVAAAGIVHLARWSKKPIIPVAFSATRAKRLRSWDRFMLALPLGGISFHAGQPIAVSDDESQAGAELERFEYEMNRLVGLADRECGQC